MSSSVGLFIAGLLLVGSIGCTRDVENRDVSTVQCEETTVEEETYCVYKKPITETGYRCPEGMPHATSLGGGTVCSGTEKVSSEHRAELKDRVNEPRGFPDASPGNDGDDSVRDIPEGLCGDLSAHEGEKITVESGFFDRALCQAKGCPSSDAGVPGADTVLVCCQVCWGEVVIACNPDDPFAGKKIALDAEVFDCGGTNCDNCGVHADQLEKVTGTLKNEEYHGSYDHTEPDAERPVYDWYIDVDNYETK